jgi:hypothetical protein
MSRFERAQAQRPKVERQVRQMLEDACLEAAAAVARAMTTSRRASNAAHAAPPAARRAGAQS